MNNLTKINPKTLRLLRKVDERLMSYNIEMTEVTGGTFWKAYTPEQVDGTENFPPISDIKQLPELLEYFPPADLANERLRALAAALGSAWIRVSGSWATKTYYDFDGHTGGKAPDGYQSVLTKEQWIGVLDFAKAVNGKLCISLANCQGLHMADEPWNPSQADQIFSLSRDYGVPIAAAEFMNEPNMLEGSGAPAGYTPADFSRDQDLFFAWLRANYPETLCIGPCATGGARSRAMGPKHPKRMKNQGAGIGEVFPSCLTTELMEGAKEPLDVFSYHCYTGISERLASLLPSGHWLAEDACTEAYLNASRAAILANMADRDLFCPGGCMWATEAGDAGGGGNTWASTYLDVFRTLNELGDFATLTDGVVFHNTLASSDYGFLQHGTYEPRPNYFAVLLWNRLMGTQVYRTGIPHRKGLHLFAHSRRDKKEGYAYLAINNSLTETTSLELALPAARYTLDAERIRSSVMRLNGRPLKIRGVAQLPDLTPAEQPPGIIELPPASCTFLVI